MAFKDNLIFALYTTGIRAGNLYIKAGSYFSEKLARLMEGRENTFSLLSAEKQKSRTGPVLWMHCSSLGEFEQGRPLIENLKERVPDIRIYLSFFSPSGYEVRKDYPHADIIFYLPADLPQVDKKLIELIRPDVFVLVKYDLWWNLLGAMHDSRIPVYLISGVYRGSEYFLQPIFSVFGDILKKFRCIFVQDSLSVDVLSKAGFFNVSLAGDTRVDRVIERAATAEVTQRIIQYTSSKKVVIYGSIWEQDVPVVKHAIENLGDFVHIIAPHDIHPSRLDSLQQAIGRQCSLFSEEKWDSTVLVINNIGMLSSLYKVADYVYVGGGFGKGIHNILEPAAYGIPVFFGPKHQKFIEATDLISLGGAREITKPVDLTDFVSGLEKDNKKYREACLASSKYIRDRSGATKIISEMLTSSLQQS